MLATQATTALSQSLIFGFQPDFVWIKDLSTSNDHNLYDVVRGANKKIVSNSTAAQATVTNVFNSFDASGFSIGDSGQINSNGNSYIAWCWKAGGAAVSNTDGTITSSVSANNTYGFSIIKHTGTNAYAGTFGHGLNSAPKFMIFKNLEATDNWFVWHTSFGSATTGAVLNSTNDYFTNGTNELNSTLPTASVIHVGSNLASNGNNQEIITYAWSEVAGFSKFGSYTGNGSTSGPSVTGLGFKPRWILIKGDLDGEDWVIVDTVRSPTNPNKKLVAPNSSAQEFTHPSTAYDMDIDNDGFTVKNTNPRWNSNGKTYIWAAFGSGSGSPEELDVLFDVPANGDQSDTGAGGEVSGNYPVFNALALNSNTLSDGNLESTGSNNKVILSTFGIPDSGKWYFELTDVDSSNGAFIGGVGALNVGVSDFLGRDANGWGYQLASNGTYYNNNSPSTTGQVNGHGSNTILGVAIDRDSNKIWFSVNNTFVNSGNPANGTNAQFSNLPSSGPLFPGASSANGKKFILNAGQRAFAYTAPTGYKALCTTNFPTPTIADGSEYFDTKLYTGNGSSQSITGLEFSPDLVWIKDRSLAGRS